MVATKRTVFLALFLALYGHGREASGKGLRWLPNTNLDNADNWDSGRPPCRNDHVIFPARAPPVYVQRNQTLLELVLPMDGELILAEGSSIAIPGRSDDASCPEKTIRFTGASPKSWFDLRHWCVLNSTGECLTSESGFLDTERVPCQSDDVLFPSGTRFFVDLENVTEVTIRSLTIDDKQMNTELFRSYLDSAEGRKMFIRQNSFMTTPTTITISGQSCNDVTGCICGNGRNTKRICDIESLRCPHLTCSDQLLPIGHCCHVCGAILHMDYGAGFTLKNLKALIKDTFQEENLYPESTNVVISKSDDDQIQAVLASSTDPSGAMRVGRAVKRELDTNPRYGAIKVTLTVSGELTPGSQTGEDTSRNTRMIVGILFGVVILVVVLLVAVYCFRNRDRIARPRLPSINLPSPDFRLPSPNFRRFFRRDDPDQSRDMELRHQPVVFDNSQIFEGSLEGFENPTYGDLFTNFRFDLPTPTSDTEKSGFSNPMYDSPVSSPESKAPLPPGCIIYDLPAKDPRPTAKESATTTVTPAEPVGKKEGGASEVTQADPESLGRIIGAPFRMAASRLRGPNLVEEEERAEDEEEAASVPEAETPAGEPESGRKSRIRLGRAAKDRQKLVEAEEVEEENQAEGELGKTKGGLSLGRARTGFENPLFEDSKGRRDERSPVSQKLEGAVPLDEESSA